MRSSVLCAAVAGAFAFSGTPADADEFRVGAWKGGPSARPDGAFSHCVMNATYNSGITVMFAISRDWTWRVGLTHPEWSMTDGQRIPVTYWIDAGARREADAQARGAALAVLELPATKEAFQAMRMGAMLTINAGQRTYRFALKDTAAGLSALSDCVSRRIPPPSAPLPSAAPAAPSVPSRARREEAQRLAVNVLAEIGAPGVQLVDPASMADAEMRTADAVWRMDGAYGSVRFMAGSAEAVAAGITAKEARACADGEFMTGVKPPSAGGGVRQIHSRCVLKNAPAMSVSHVIARRGEGESVVFTTVTPDQPSGEQVDRPADRAMENGMQAAVRAVLFK